MDPITLHFNIFQAGAPVRTSLQVEDPSATTIKALKEQLFSDEIKASKSVRFIAAGKILDDATALERYKLGKEAHIHVSINDGARPQSPTSAPEGNASATSAAEEARTSSDTSSNETGVSMVGWAILAGVILFAGTGILLWVAFQKRRQYTMHTSQLLFICAAIWVYLLLCHALPSLFQALNKLGNSSAPKDTPMRSTSTSSVTAGASVGNEAAGAASSSAASPASPGLSLMTPTLPPGDATAASVLTQRR